MEIHYPGLIDNSHQMALIQRKAKELGVSPDSIAQEWVDNFSPRFRELWDLGIHEIAELEDRIYDQPLDTPFADMVVAILSKTPNPRFTSL